MFVLEKPTVLEKMHYSGPSGGGGYGHQPTGGNAYSSIGHSSYGYGGDSSHGKRSIALSALTLLAFLFFLHILQTCLQEQMDSQNTQIVMMSARVENKAAELLKKRKGETEDVLDEYQDEPEKKSLQEQQLKRAEDINKKKEEKEMQLVKIS